MVFYGSNLLQLVGQQHKIPKQMPTSEHFCELICFYYFLYIEKEQVRIKRYIIDFSPEDGLYLYSPCNDKEHSNIKCSWKMDLPLIGRNSDVLVVNSTGQASKCQY